MDKHIIAGVHIVNREAHAPAVQALFTKYGAQIHTRLGLHDNVNPANGLILLEMADTPEALQLIDGLKAMEGVDCQVMMFEH